MAQTPWSDVVEMRRMPYEKLRQVHGRLSLVHGSLDQEVVMQLLLLAYVPSDACVLELGGHVGRTSCIIATILDDDRRHVVLEIDPSTADKLRDNRDANGFRFEVEAAALAARPVLLEVTSDTLRRRSAPAGNESAAREWWPARRLAWPDLCARYCHLHFDVLVVGCGAALPAICADYPGFMTGFQTVIVQTDGGDSVDDATMAREGFHLAIRVPQVHSVWTRAAVVM